MLLLKKYVKIPSYFKICSSVFNVKVISSIEARKESNFDFFYALFPNTFVRYFCYSHSLYT